MDLREQIKEARSYLVRPIILRNGQGRGAWIVPCCLSEFTARSASSPMTSRRPNIPVTGTCTGDTERYLEVIAVL